MEDGGALEGYIKELNARIALQLENRKLIENSTPLTDEMKRKLDSTLKRTTAFMKRLKNISVGQQDAIISDLEKVNMSKFVEEMAFSLADVKIKMCDVPTYIAVCMRIACLYPEFPSLLLAEFKKCVPIKRMDKIINSSKLRVDLRVIAELFLNGVFDKPGLSLLGSVVSYLTLTDQAEYTNVPILLPMCKMLGPDIVGAHPLSIQKEAAADRFVHLPMPSSVSTEQKSVFAHLLLNYRKSLIDHIQQNLNGMNRLQRCIKKQIRTRGDASADDKTKLDEAKAVYDRFMQSGCNLSEVLGIEMEEMTKEQSDDEDEDESTFELHRALQDGTLSIWPDEDTRQFYETRKQLRDIVPAILFEESEQRTLEPVCSSMDDVDLTGLEDIPECDEDMADEEEPYTNDGDGENEPQQQVDIDEASLQMVDLMSLKHYGQDLRQTMKAFLEKLPWLINRDLIDEAALTFVTDLNTKVNRKKLHLMMLKQHLDRYDLLPFYGRLIATLEPVMPDFAIEVSTDLMRQFKASVQNKGKEASKKKIRLCRFISELVKFGVIPKSEAIRCLRMLLFDFRGPNIDMCCAMIDSMGLFLYRSTESHTKTKVVLDVMMKKRERITDARLQVLIDNAYFTCIPPVHEEKVEPLRPAMHEYIRRQIINLTSSNLENTARIWRRIDWTDQTIREDALSYLCTPSLVSIDNLPELASLVSVLCHYHDFIGNRIVDSILENIRLFLELNDPSLNQSAFLDISYLGQLYTFAVCDTNIIFYTLYQLITFCTCDPYFDGWNQMMRIRLVSQMLMICGEFFNAGSAKKKLDCFIVYFNRYVWAKKEGYAARDQQFPYEIQFKLEETMNYIKKASKLPKNFEDAQQAVCDMEMKYKQLAEEALNADREDDDDDTNQDDDDSEREDDGVNNELSSSGSYDSNSRRRSYGMEDSESSSGERHKTVLYDDDEEVMESREHVKTKEEEEFDRNFEMLVTESLQVQVRVPQKATTPSEIVVPTAVRQKFHRTVLNEETEDTYGGDLRPKEGLRLGILMRAKGNKTVLKPISLDDHDMLEDTWKAEKEKEQKEFDEHKHITLSISDRMMADDAVLSSD